MSKNPLRAFVSSCETKKQEAKPAPVPKLRFPEFRGAEGWQPNVLEELENLGWVELGRGDVISAHDIKAIPGDYPIYSSSVKNNGLMGTYGRFMFDEELISWSVDGGGDFFHRPRHKFSVTNVSGYMRLNTSHLNYRFLSSHLQALHTSQTFDYQFKAHPSVIRKLYRLVIPTLAEQQKIADCLSALDELIAAQARKVDALKTHKKGLMQQLFPREGETQPRLRFPEFQDAGEWIECTVAEIITTITPPKKLQTADYQLEGKFPVIDQSQEAICGWTNDRDALISGGLPVIIFGDHTCALKFVDHPFVQGADGIKVLKPKSGMDVRFLFCALEANPVVPEAYKRHFSVLKEKKVSFPDPKTSEQHRIASCLSSLDALITAETQKHEALKTHKKGLMQQLFPSPGEVEG